jgi:hypothetical protein
LADEIIMEMDRQLKMPAKIGTPEAALIRENRRRERITVEGQSNANEIGNCLKDNNIKIANEYRFIGIIKLIGTMETGFYENLNNNKETIEKIIKEYIEEIKE